MNAKHEQISSNIKKEKVVYTCNIGNYDIMFPQKFFNQEWDYVYITDNPTLLKDQYRNGWKIIPPIFNSGAPQQMHLVHKINAHTMFSEYKESLYIDANINLISNKIFEEIKNHPNNLILVQGHQVPISIYEYIDKTVDDDIIDFNKLMLIKYLLRSNIHKKNIELIDSNVIYRKHNSECIRTVMMQWYSDIINLNMPEKLSLMYNLKLNNIDLNNIVINNINKEHLNYIAYEHLNN